MKRSIQWKKLRAIVKSIQSYRHIIEKYILDDKLLLVNLEVVFLLARVLIINIHKYT